MSFLRQHCFEDQRQHNSQGQQNAPLVSRLSKTATTMMHKTNLEQDQKIMFWLPGCLIRNIESFILSDLLPLAARQSLPVGASSFAVLFQSDAMHVWSDPDETITHMQANVSELLAKGSEIPNGSPSAMNGDMN